MSIEAHYGLSTNLFVSRKAGGDSFVVGGTAEDASRWTRVLSQRAAQMLWSQLAHLLFPDKAHIAVAVVMTAPLRSSDKPTITSHVTIAASEKGHYDIVGWVDKPAWEAQLSQDEARRFWDALDITLYPAGWQPKAQP